MKFIYVYIATSPCLLFVCLLCCLTVCVCRRPFKDFLYQFKFIDLGITENPSLSPRAACEALLEKAKVDSKSCQVNIKKNKYNNLLLFLGDEIQINNKL